MMWTKLVNGSSAIRRGSVGYHRGISDLYLFNLAIVGPGTHSSWLGRMES